MFEKVNPVHPDKIADRIAGAIVDLAYKKQENPKVAVEVLLGHGVCHILGEVNVGFEEKEIKEIVKRISGIDCIDFKLVPQDVHLAENQSKLRCGDNGIFKGAPLTDEEKFLTNIAYILYDNYNSDGKYIVDKGKLIICQSNAREEAIKALIGWGAIVNPLGDWTGGPNVDSGATNRKLGSDMGSAVTGGGLHGKDLSKADVSINIYAMLKARTLGQPIEISCAIGDEIVDGRPYSDIVKVAKGYIDSLGGFEKLAEWGLVNVVYGAM